jgi:hypothetical protein
MRCDASLAGGIGDCLTPQLFHHCQRFGRFLRRRPGGRWASSAAEPFAVAFPPTSSLGSPRTRSCSDPVTGSTTRPCKGRTTAGSRPDGEDSTAVGTATLRFRSVCGDPMTGSSGSGSPSAAYGMRGLLDVLHLGEGKQSPLTWVCMDGWELVAATEQRIDDRATSFGLLSWLWVWSRWWSEMVQFAHGRHIEANTACALSATAMNPVFLSAVSLAKTFNAALRSPLDQHAAARPVLAINHSVAGTRCQWIRTARARARGPRYQILRRDRLEFNSLSTWGLAEFQGAWRVEEHAARLIQTRGDAGDASPQLPVDRQTPSLHHLSPSNPLASSSVVVPSRG